MNTARHLSLALAGFLWLLLSPLRVEAQALTESRDPLRGVTFYSIQLSTDRLSDLQSIGGLFGNKDKMTLGVSAFVFDESETVSEYVVWLRHDGGKRWFTSDTQRPLTVRLAPDTLMQPEPVHRLGALRTASSMVEKLEFVLDPSTFDKIVGAESTVMVINTLLGTIEKTLTDGERAALRRFGDRISTQRLESPPA